ncbi:MAG: DUF4292 domain-containing protein [Chitinophagaceae bacterium]|nr:DUF4292 domain-containing protein [Chitinophagaceae bacterium]
MNKYFVYILIALISATNYSCKTTKNINNAIAKKDTVIIVNHTITDSIDALNKLVTTFNSHRIDFKTFNAKIKVDYDDSKGKKQDATAIVRIIKDSAIWISISATFLNIEAFRVLIKKDSVILLNKLEKEVQYRSLDYLQEVTAIPFDYATLQDLLIGNPIFMDSNIVTYKKMENAVLISTVGEYFKHLLTLSPDNYLLLHSKLDDVDVTRNRTADITYTDYENKNGIDFSTSREITVSEKNKLDVKLNYKQYEFNKDLSVSFNIPKNYKKK